MASCLKVIYRVGILPSSRLLLSRCLTIDNNGLRVTVKDALVSQPLGKRIRVMGWVRALRKQKDNIFFDLCDGSCFQRLQVVLSSLQLPRDLSYGCSVEVMGELVPSTHSGQYVELKPELVTVCGPCNLETYPIQARKQLPADYLRQYLHLRPRTRTFGSVLRIRNAAVYAIHEFFQKRGFIFISTPIITSNDCEGAGETFNVQAVLNDKDSSSKNYFFENNAFLTVSTQLHLESLASALTKVYTIGPTFRAENSRTRHHLAEFFMLETEMAFVSTVEELIQCIETLVKSVSRCVLDRCPDDVAWLHKHSENKINLPKLLDEDFIRITYTEAVAILQKLSDVPSIKWGQDLLKEHERQLVQYYDGMPVFLMNFPKNIKPFYMKCSDSQPETVDAVDLLVPNVGEICGGSVREHRFDELHTRMEDLKLLNSLKWYLDLRRFGTCAHAGFGLGFDRFLQYFMGISNIKDVVPFPRWPHHCPM